MCDAIIAPILPFAQSARRLHLPRTSHAALEVFSRRALWAVLDSRTTPVPVLDVGTHSSRRTTVCCFAGGTSPVTLLRRWPTSPGGRVCPPSWRNAPRRCSGRIESGGQLPLPVARPGAAREEGRRGGHTETVPTL